MPDYSFLDAGAFQNLVDLTANWNSLRQPNSPFIFQGGWNAHFTEAKDLFPTVGTDFATVQDTSEGTRHPLVILGDTVPPTWHIRELRRVYPDFPYSKLKELIEMNKNLYPEMLKKVTE